MFDGEIGIGAEASEENRKLAKKKPCGVGWRADSVEDYQRARAEQLAKIDLNTDVAKRSIQLVDVVKQCAHEHAKCEEAHHQVSIKKDKLAKLIAERKEARSRGYRNAEVLISKMLSRECRAIKRAVRRAKISKLLTEFKA